MQKIGFRRPFVSKYEFFKIIKSGTYFLDIVRFLERITYLSPNNRAINRIFGQYCSADDSPAQNTSGNHEKLMITISLEYYGQSELD